MTERLQGFDRKPSFQLDFEELEDWVRNILVEQHGLVLDDQSLNAREYLRVLPSHRGNELLRPFIDKAMADGLEIDRAIEHRTREGLVELSQGLQYYLAEGERILVVIRRNGEEGDEVIELAGVDFGEEYSAVMVARDGNTYPYQEFKGLLEKEEVYGE